VNWQLEDIKLFPTGSTTSTQKLEELILEIRNQSKSLEENRRNFMDDNVGIHEHINVSEVNIMNKVTQAMIQMMEPNKITTEEVREKLEASGVEIIKLVRIIDEHLSIIRNNLSQLGENERMTLEDLSIAIKENLFNNEKAAEGIHKEIVNVTEEVKQEIKKLNVITENGFETGKEEMRINNQKILLELENQTGIINNELPLN
jgi:hypothetical protein